VGADRPSVDRRRSGPIVRASPEAATSDRTGKVIDAREPAEGGPGEPQADRPHLFGGHPEPALLPWRWAVERLVAARHYWVATTRPDGRPHTRPVWGVWRDGAVWFSTGSMAVSNLAALPAATVHLESGGEVVILEGVVRTVSDPSLLTPVVAVYNGKYRWDLDAARLPGPFFALEPDVAFGWVSDPSGLDAGAAFGGTATRWRFRAET
jgi:hypothetical protein